MAGINVARDQIAPLVAKATAAVGAIVDALAPGAVKPALAAVPAKPADLDITLKPGQTANIGLEEAPAAGGPAAITGELQELLKGLTAILGKLAALVQQLMAQGLGALTGGDQRADLTKPQAGGPGTKPSTPPKWNGDGTYTLPGGQVVKGGDTIPGYTWNPGNNHYTDTATGQMVGDPLKISLDGKDATVNSTDHALVKKDDGSLIRTSGGLNDNEAWLVQDKDDNGSIHGGVIDGKELIGDHGGKYKNGYDQLAKDYADEIKTDAQGRKYLDTASGRVATELKLAKKDGTAVAASSVVKKLYLDNAEVNQQSADGKTSIRQTGDVEYLDGHRAKAADEWWTETAV